MAHELIREKAAPAAALLAPSWEKYGDKPFVLEEGMVFTIRLLSA